MRNHPHHDFTIQLDHEAEDAVGRRMLRAKIEQ
jgi:hypothetical protein